MSWPVTWPGDAGTTISPQVGVITLGVEDLDRAKTFDQSVDAKETL